MALPQLTCEVYTSGFVRTGFINDFIGYDVHFRHGEQSTASITIDADHYYIPAVLTDGARSVLHFGNLAMSGVIISKRGDSGPPSTVTFDVEDDWRLGRRILGWPNPTQPITSQGAASKYYTVTGPAETVVKDFLSANIDRLGLDIVVAATQNRGARITASTRMHPIWDRLLPLVTNAGLGVSVLQGTATLVVDCYETAYLAHEVGPDSGVLDTYTWELHAPTTTRAVVGGAGEGTAREFRVVSDPVLEGAWRDVQEVFVDARDVESADTGTLDQRGRDALVEGAPRTSLALTLTDNDLLVPGVNVAPGDYFPTRLVPGAPAIVAHIIDVNPTLTDDGPIARLAVGDRTDDSSRSLWRSVAAVARAVRNDRAGR